MIINFNEILNSINNYDKKYKVDMLLEENF